MMRAEHSVFKGEFETLREKRSDKPGCEDLRSLTVVARSIRSIWNRCGRPGGWLL